MQQALSDCYEKSCDRNQGLGHKLSTSPLGSIARPNYNQVHALLLLASCISSNFKVKRQNKYDMMSYNALPPQLIIIYTFIISSLCHKGERLVLFVPLEDYIGEDSFTYSITLGVTKAPNSWVYIHVINCRRPFDPPVGTSCKEDIFVPREWL